MKKLQNHVRFEHQKLGNECWSKAWLAVNAGMWHWKWRKKNISAVICRLCSFTLKPWIRVVWVVWGGDTEDMLFVVMGWTLFTWPPTFYNDVWAYDVAAGRQVWWCDDFWSQKMWERNENKWKLANGTSKSPNGKVQSSSKPPFFGRLHMNFPGCLWFLLENESYGWWISGLTGWYDRFPYLQGFVNLNWRRASSIKHPLGFGHCLFGLAPLMWKRS